MKRIGVTLSLFFLLSTPISLARGENAELSNPNRAFVPRVRNVQEKRGLKQRQYAELSWVYFRNNPLPDEVTEQEREQVKQAYLLDANTEEIKILQHLFGTDLNLAAYVMRDSDADGINDYKVVEYYGKIVELDTDVDGDGILNVFDVAPYDATAGGKDTNHDGRPDEEYADHDQDTIPDHIDFDLLSYKASLAKQQVRILQELEIILVDRNQRFSEGLVQAIEDAFRYGFKFVVKDDRLAFKTLRTIAMEATGTIFPDGTIAQEYPETKTITFYRTALQYTPLRQLGLVVHEISHSLQVIEDVQPRGTFNFRTPPQIPKLAAKLSKIGWSGIEEWGSRPKRKYVEFVYENLDERNRSELKYYDVPITKWWNRTRGLYNGAGSNSLTSKFSIVSNYSLTDPYEFYSENHNAYLNYVLEQHVRAKHGKQGVIAFRKMDWSYKSYEQIRIVEFFEKHAPIASEDAMKLYQRYVEPFLDE
jgi:hypothetical protein